MPVLPITIHHKHAVYTGAIPYVCSNSDYEVVFIFDDEWKTDKEKTVRFCAGEQCVDRIMSGNTCKVPVFETGDFLQIGVFAGNLHTSTAAMVRMCDSIRTMGGVPAEPEETVYDQIMERLNASEEDVHEISGALREYTKNAAIKPTVIDAVIVGDSSVVIDGYTSEQLTALSGCGETVVYGRDHEGLVLIAKCYPNSMAVGTLLAFGEDEDSIVSSSCIVRFADENDHAVGRIVVVGGASGEAELSEVHRRLDMVSDELAERFENVIWMASKEGYEGDVVLPEQTITTGLVQNLQYALQPDHAYDVYINGAVYTCEAHAYGSSGACLGNGTLGGAGGVHNNEPFCILWAGGTATGCMFFRDSTLQYPITVKVTEHSTVTYNKLPKEFLPDGVVMSVNGVKPDASGNVEIVISDSDNTEIAEYIDYDLNVKSVNHRGYSAEAPENTIPAYILSKKKGFKYAECDVSFTSDGVAVLLHDATIDRTSNGSGNINSITYNDALNYDFGSWKSSAYAGTKIPTFEEFIMTCKAIGLHPYIELKNNGGYTQEQITGIVNTVKKAGMDGKVTYISFSASYLGYVKAADDSARLGYLSSSANQAVINTALGLKTSGNAVFVDIKYTAITDTFVSLCAENNLPLEIWTVNSQDEIEGMNSYVTGVTSDNLIAGKILYDKYMTYTAPDVPDEPDNPEITLTSISATYSGGSVPVGTSVNSLKGLVVTGAYSNGTTSPVTGYTLSGTIAEGTNTITVSYGGKTTTFTVIGVTESGGETEPDEPDVPADTGLLYSWDFTKSTVDTVSSKQAVLSNFAIDYAADTSTDVDVTATIPVQGSDGISLTQAGQYIYLGDLSLLGKTIEIDVANFDFKGSADNHIRLLGTGNLRGYKPTVIGYSPLLWKKGTGWSAYMYTGSNKAWSDKCYDGLEGTSADIINYFSGKTIKLVIDGDGIVTLYADDVLIGSPQGIAYYGNMRHITIGGCATASSSSVSANQATGNQCYNCTITGVRIYENT